MLNLNMHTCPHAGITYMYTYLCNCAHTDMCVILTNASTYTCLRRVLCFACGRQEWVCRNRGRAAAKRRFSRRAGFLGEFVRDKLLVVEPRSLMLPRSVAVLPCHLGWRTLLKCNSNHACLPACLIVALLGVCHDCAQERYAETCQSTGLWVMATKTQKQADTKHTSAFFLETQRVLIISRNSE
jgi:hypothetical protein